MRHAWPLFLLLSCATSCASIRLAERPMGRQDSGAGVVVGRIQVDGMPDTGWDDPFDKATGSQILLVQFRTRHGDRLLAPCRSDGVFVARLPVGMVSLESAALTTPHGSWINLHAIRPMPIPVEGACDLGAIRVTIPSHHLREWSRLRQSERVIRQSGSIPVHLHPAPDGLTGAVLASLAEGKWTWTTHPLTRSQGVYDRFEALCRRLGIN